MILSVARPGQFRSSSELALPARRSLVQIKVRRELGILPEVGPHPSYEKSQSTLVCVRHAQAARRLGSLSRVEDRPSDPQRMIDSMGTHCLAWSRILAIYAR